MSSNRSGAQRRQGRPPEQKFFSGLWKPLGFRSAALELPGLSVRLDGMDDVWHAAFLHRYRGYARDTTSDPAPCTLMLSTSRAQLDYFIEPPAAGVVEYNPVFLEVEPEAAATGHHRVRVSTYSLAASFSTRGGRGQALLSQGEYEPVERAAENVLRVAIAWLASARGGLLIHSASIVKDGRAYLFFGQSGSGKSTLSERSRRGHVVSDDLTLILPDEGGRLEVVGAPFRGTYEGGKPVFGRYPVAAGFRLRKAGPGEPAAVEPMEPGNAMADAIANLPFVVDQLGADPSLFARVEKALAAFPIHALRFRMEDDSYWDAIESAGI
ncbi:MAG TPA: hypothetical protein VGK94_12585 [Candidatus Polarisedimenticolia bacterium]